MFSRSVGRFAARWVQRYSQRWFSTGSTQVESIQPDEYAAAIKRLNKSNKLLRLLMFTTFSATTAAVGWQIYDFNPTNRIGAVINMIRQSNEQTVKEGLDELNSCFYINKRVFSGKVAIPVSHNAIAAHEPDLVYALMRAAVHTSPEVSARALSWLHELCGAQASIRSQLVIQEKVPELIAIITGPSKHSQKDWLIASSILIKVLSDPNASGKISASDRLAISTAIDSLAARRQEPLALFVAAKLAETSGLKKAPEGYGGAVGAEILSYATKQALVPTAEHVPLHYGANMISILATSALASVYASFWWRTRALKKKLTNVKGVNQWLASRHVGSKVFALLVADMLAQRLMSFASTDTLSFDLKRFDETTSSNETNKILSSNLAYLGLEYLNSTVGSDKPPALSSMYPIAQTAIFGIGSLILLRRARFVMLPLSLALIYNHRDYLQSFETVQYVTDVSLAHLSALLPFDLAVLKKRESDSKE